MKYFCGSANFRKLMTNHPQLMVIPWEHQRAMGIVALADPTVIEYTFISHQWESPSHPFFDLKQITEHLHLIMDPYFWCARSFCMWLVAAMNQTLEAKGIV